MNRRMRQMLDTIGRDPTVQQHIRETIAAHKADPGEIITETLPHGSILTHWIGGEYAKVNAGLHAELQRKRDEGSLAFDFCTLASVPSHEGAPYCLIIMRRAIQEAA